MSTDVLTWIKLIHDPSNPPTDEQRAALRKWLIETPKNAKAFREHVALVMQLYYSPEFPREQNPNYLHFMHEAITAQVDAGITRIPAQSASASPTH